MSFPCQTGGVGLPQYQTSASDRYPSSNGSVSTGARLNSLRQPGSQNGRNGRGGSGASNGIDLAGITSFGGLVDSSGMSKEILDAVAQQVGFSLPQAEALMQCVCEVCLQTSLLYVQSTCKGRYFLLCFFPQAAGQSGSISCVAGLSADMSRLPWMHS